MWQHQTSLFDTHTKLDKIADELCISIKNELDIDACSLFTHEKNDLFNLEATTLTPLLSGLIFIDTENDAIGSVVQKKEALFIKKLSRSDSNSILSSLTRQRITALYAAPIIFESNVIGILVIQSNNAETINDSMQTSITTLCTNLSARLAYALKKDEIEEQIEEALPRNKAISFSGKGITTGAIIGEAYVRHNIFDLDSIPDKPTQSDNEIELFQNAVRHVNVNLTEMAKRINELATQEESALFEAYMQILQSTRFRDAIINEITSGVWVQSAIKNVVKRQITVFQNMDDPYLRERAKDLEDIAKRVLRQLQPLSTKTYPRSTILVSHEITPSMLAEVPKGQLNAIVSERGTENSHVAILARALGIPFVIGFQSLPLGFIDGQKIIVDGYTGKIYVNPGKGLTKAYQRLALREEEKLLEFEKARDLPCCTIDHQIIKIQANVGLVADLNKAEENCSGIGLYRTEIPFMTRESFPSEDEQRIIYSQFLNAFPKDSVTIRTLDVGADKALPYFDIQEDNPALGWRGTRMMLDQPNLLLTQVRAMMKASAKYNNLKILLPMISEANEVREALKVIHRAHHELSDEGTSITYPKVGIMIEVPSIIYQLTHVLPLIDFISIGSNDLAQYILATDRNNSKVAPIYNQLHPAVLQALDTTCRHAHQQKKEISICGEMASNPIAIPILIGMGIKILSMHAINALKIRWMIQHINYETCKALKDQALKLDNTADIKELLSQFLVDHKLGSLIKAGN